MLTLTTTRRTGIPAADKAEFAFEGDGARAHVLRVFAIIDRVHATGGSKMAAYASVAKQFQETPKRVQTWVQTWERTGDWRRLINRAKWPEPSAGKLPAAFLTFWRELVMSVRGGRRHGKAKAAHDMLLERLVRWERGDDSAAIPGYATPPRRMTTNHLPLGWTYSNLSRPSKRGSKYAETLVDIGPKAASRYMPSVRRTRRELVVGEFIEIDDQEEDLNVVFDVTGHGRGQIFRPLGLHAIDVASACVQAAGYKPKLVDATGTRRKLTEEDTMWFVVHMMTQHGYHPERGTVIVGEHGTATLRGEFLDCLRRATEGLVRFDTSGLYGDPAFRAMMFRAPGSGNFRFKSRVEGHFSFYRRHMMQLPGATGPGRHSKPEELEAMVKYGEWLIRGGEGLSPERQALLMLPVLSWTQFVPLANEIIERKINRRTDHQLEGWEQNIVSEFLLGDQWLPAAALMDPSLTEAQRQLLVIAANMPGACRPRQMSPREVWDRGAKSLRKVHDCLWPVLIPQKYAEELRVNDRLEFVVKDSEVQRDPLVYVATARNDRNHEIALRRGETYLCYRNPWAPDRMQVCEATGSRRGAWIGTVHQHVPAGRADIEQIQKHFGDIRHALAHEVAAARRAVDPVMQARQQMKDWNARVLDASTPLLPEEHAEAATHHAHATSLADILGRVVEDDE